LGSVSLEDESADHPTLFDWIQDQSIDLNFVQIRPVLTRI